MSTGKATAEYHAMNHFERLIDKTARSSFLDATPTKLSQTFSWLSKSLYFRLKTNK